MMYKFYRKDLTNIYKTFLVASLAASINSSITSPLTPNLNGLLSVKYSKYLPTASSCSSKSNEPVQKIL